MAKQFAGFTPKQTATLLQKMGYTGPADSKAMAQFIAANPAAAAKLGKYTETAQRMISGIPAAKTMPPAAAMGMQVGGLTATNTLGSNISTLEGTKVRDSVLNAVQQGGTGITATGTSPFDAVSATGTTGATTTAAPAKTAEQAAWEEYKSFKPTPDDMFGAKRFAGRTFTDPATGTTYTSDGTKWTVSDAGAKKYVTPEGETTFVNPKYQEPPAGSRVVEDLGVTGATTGVSFPEGDIPYLPPNATDLQRKKYERDLQTYREKSAIAAADLRADPEALNRIRTQLNNAQVQRNNYLQQIQTLPADDPRRNTLAQLIKEADDAINVLQQQVSTIGGAEIRGAQQALVTKAYTAPEELVTKAAPAAISETAKAAGEIPSGTGALGAITAPTATTAAAKEAAAPTQAQVSTMEASKVGGAIEGALGGPAVGAVSAEAQMQGTTFDPLALSQLGLTPAQISQAQQIATVPDLSLTQNQLATAATLASMGASLPQAIAQTTGKVFNADAARFQTPTPEAVAATAYTLTPTQLSTMAVTNVEAAAKASEIPTAQAAQSSWQSTIQAAQGTVGANELVNARDIIAGAKAVEAIAATDKALNDASVMAAAQGTFSQAAIAKAEQGVVSESSTIQGQMASLMSQFNNGTPAWAAGAMRAANAAMAARGLGASSMAAAAIVQTAMEAALPIAAQDAQVFANMNMQNLANRQQVAIVNAAAQQNLELANLSNQQQAALQNSTNSFALQSQNLSNTQAVVLANAQFKAALQEQTLNITTQTALANAARYAEMNNINLNNEQQARLQNSAQNLQIEISNLSNRQQTALSNLQVRAALIGQELSNEQQMAVLKSTQNFERAAIDANNKQQAFLQDAAAKAALEGKVLDNKQQTALFNVANAVAERNLELSNEQQTRLFNTANNMQIEIANLSNKQQTVLANAQIEAAVRGQELTNTQQTNVVNAARVAEIANLNFTAQQQRAVENARLAQTVDIANLDAKNAKVLADAAAMSQLDLANLNNRQQAAVQNAQAFLQMDMANLNNQQQTLMFNSQARVQALLTDAASENAAKQFNASSQMQVDQFNAGLTAQISQFNTAQKNALEQFNAGEANAISKFNAEIKNARDIFEAQNATTIAQSNATWRQNITTLESTQLHQANMEAARAATGLTQTAMEATWQRERDLMQYAFTAAENSEARATEILLAKMNNDATSAIAMSKQKSDSVTAIFSALAQLDFFS